MLGPGPSPAVTWVQGTQAGCCPELAAPEQNSHESVVQGVGSTPDSLSGGKCWGHLSSPAPPAASMTSTVPHPLGRCSKKRLTAPAPQNRCRCGGPRWLSCVYPLHVTGICPLRAEVITALNSDPLPPFHQQGPASSCPDPSSPDVGPGLCRPALGVTRPPGPLCKGHTYTYTWVWTGPPALPMQLGHRHGICCRVMKTMSNGPCPWYESRVSPICFSDCPSEVSTEPIPTPSSHRCHTEPSVSQGPMPTLGYPLHGLPHQPPGAHTSPHLSLRWPRNFYPPL